MKKVMLLLASLVVFTACSQPKQDTKESTSTQTAKKTKVSESSKEEKELKFVVAPQYEGKTSELIELGKKWSRNILNSEVKVIWRSTSRELFLKEEQRSCWSIRQIWISRKI